MPEKDTVQKTGNTKIKQLQERNAELTATNAKLRQDRDTLLHKINQVKKGSSDSELQSQKIAEFQANNKFLREKLAETENKISALQKKLKQQRVSNLEAQSILEVNNNELFEKSKQLKAELKHKDDMIALAQTESERARAEVRSYATSTSWKLTAPVRSLINLVRR